MNRYQSVFTEEDFRLLPKEVKNDFYEYLSTVKFINWLIQPEDVRGFAKDRPRHNELSEDDPRKEYDDSRIVVNLTQPHILEDLDYFRERAIFFDKNHRYTDITPNSNKKSLYAEFWKEEQRKWKYGVVRPSDGEWIPGGLYFYWNYNPIWLTEEDSELKVKGKKKKGERIREFPEPWLGDYLFFHYLEQARNRGQHAKLLKTRGVGFSFKMASLSPRNMYVYPGSGNPNFHLASDKGFLQGDKGVYGKVLDTLDWIAIYTPLPKLRIGDGKKAMEIQLGFQDEYGIRKGLLSSVYGISMKDDPDKARGIRGPLVHYEEDGKFPNLESTWNINRKATEDGDVTFGMQVSGGTGGSMSNDFAGSERLFYYPKPYNIYGVPNVYDKNTDGKNECGFFWGAYLNRKGYTDSKSGEPDVTGALLKILIGRYTTKSGAVDSKTITQNRAEECITPQDAIMRAEGSIFPVADLKDYLSEISPNLERFIAPHYVGTLSINIDGKVEFSLNSNVYPIRDYPALDNKMGGVEIFELPGKNPVPYRFIVGVDGYDDDDVGYSDSLGSCIVYDTWTRRIVAEYTGRPQTANEFYEICYRLAVFYNATIMYENNKKGLYGYFNNIKKAVNLLADTPEIITDKQTLKPRGTLTNTSKGINATVQINSYGRRLQADWMVEEAYQDEGIQIHGEDDTKEKVFIPNLRKIRSVGYIKEAIAWNSDINTDRISAMNMVMIYEAELMSRDFKQHQQKIKTLAQDPFFNRYNKGLRNVDEKVLMKGWNV